jgi:hypothetical protein
MHPAPLGCEAIPQSSFRTEDSDRFKSGRCSFLNVGVTVVLLMFFHEMLVGEFTADSAFEGQLGSLDIDVSEERAGSESFGTGARVQRAANGTAGPTVGLVRNPESADPIQAPTAAAKEHPAEGSTSTAVVSGKAKPIALCIMGQPRAHEDILWHTMYARMLRPIEAETDVFFAFSNGNSFGTHNPAHTDERPHDFAYGRSLFRPKAAFDYIEAKEGMVPVGGDRLHYKGHPVESWGAYQALAFKKCGELIFASEVERGYPYEYVLKYREDEIPSGEMPPFSEWPRRSILTRPVAWVPSLGNCGFGTKTDGTPEGKACVNDHFAVLTGGWAARSYLSGIFHDFCIQVNATKGHLGPCPECSIGYVVICS